MNLLYPKAAYDIHLLSNRFKVSSHKREVLVSKKTQSFEKSDNI